MKRIDYSAEEGFKDFRRVDEGLDNQPIRKMSRLTQRMMQSIDYETVAKRRRANFVFFNDHLGKNNKIDLPLDSDAVPLVYPYLVSLDGLREILIENKIFVARYWPNVLLWTNLNDFEYYLASHMQPLPVDQRYGEKEIRRILLLLSK